AFLGDRQHDGDGTVQQPGHRLDERRTEEFHLAYLVEKVNVHFSNTGQFFLHHWLKLLRFDAVAADPLPGPRPDVGQECPPAREGNGLEADPLPLLAYLLGIEAGQAQITQPLGQAADDVRLAAARRASKRVVLDRVLLSHRFTSPSVNL